MGGRVNPNGRGNPPPDNAMATVRTRAEGLRRRLDQYHRVDTRVLSQYGTVTVEGGMCQEDKGAAEQLFGRASRYFSPEHAAYEPDLEAANAFLDGVEQLLPREDEEAPECQDSNARALIASIEEGLANRRAPRFAAARPTNGVLASTPRPTPPPSAPLPPPAPKREVVVTLAHLTVNGKPIGLREALRDQTLFRNTPEMGMAPTYLFVDGNRLYCLQGNEIRPVRRGFGSFSSDELKKMIADNDAITFSALSVMLTSGDIRPYLDRSADPNVVYIAAR